MKLVARGLRCVGTLALVCFASCATLSERQCKGGDWYDIGLRDGMEGYGTDRLSKHGEACKEYGVSPNQPAYEKGRQEGIKSYCLPENAYRIGRTGGYYRGGCPASLEAPFLRKYEAGRQVHRIEERVNSLYNEITDLENQMDRETDANRRQTLREKLRDRQRERDELQRHLTVLEIKGDG